MALCISFPHWEFVSELRWRGFFEGLSQEADFSETSAPLSLIKTFQINLISAGSISLDSPLIIFTGLVYILKNIYKVDERSGPNGILLAFS
jgi:hypothetical protein